VSNGDPPPGETGGASEFAGWVVGASVVAARRPNHGLALAGTLALGDAELVDDALLSRRAPDAGARVHAARALASVDDAQILQQTKKTTEQKGCMCDWWARERKMSRNGEFFCSTGATERPLFFPAQLVRKGIALPKGRNSSACYWIRKERNRKRERYLRFLSKVLPPKKK